MNNDQSPIQSGLFATWIRNWVHYDTLSVNFSKQSTTSRKIKDEFETKIIETLKAQKMENAQIQIAGAKLGLVQEKSYPSLTVGRLEEYLHLYFKTKGVDETDQIMKFIKQQKLGNYELQTHLRKTVSVAVPPAPPDSAAKQLQ